jgi:hypothetical protein
VHCLRIPDLEHLALLLKNKPVYLCITGEYHRLTEQACLENWTISVVVQQLNFKFKMS